MRVRLARRVGALVHKYLNLRVLYLGILGVVLLTLAMLQNRWIDEASRAQEAGAKARLHERVRLISDALDTEIARAALVFTLPPGSASGLYDALGQRWAIWNHDAPWPKIVFGVSLVESTGAGWHTRSLGDAGAFDLRSLLPSDAFSDSRQPAPDGAYATGVPVRIPDQFTQGQPYLLRMLPTFWEPAGPPRMNWVLIHYNLDYLAGAVFPQLVEKNVSAEERVQFRFQIDPKGANTLGTIVAAGALRNRPDCLLPNDAGFVGTVVGGARNGRGIVSHVEHFPPQLAGAQPDSLASLLHAAGQCQTPAPPSSPGLMQLSVRHAQGAGVLSGFRRRNEILSSLVLAVLLAALAALIVSTERARKLARLQTVIAAGISHELRTPLASLTVAADHLKNGHVENAGQARRYGEIIEVQSRRLRHIIDQALALTTLRDSNGLPCSRTVSLPEIIHASIDSLAPSIREAGIEIECRTAPDVPMIMADPDLVLRCLTNLIENSIKYAGAGGWVQVSARAGHRAGRLVAELAVEDRGPGIPDEETTAVFEPFYRGSSARQSRRPGSGLGLSIVKSAVEAHGGWIKLEPAVPQGCRFQLFFPAADHAHAVPSAEPEVQHNDVSSHIAR
jgi:signal transduction histidine kinase